jgi:hypothetical protein
MTEYRDAFYQRIAPECLEELHQCARDCKERVHADSMQLIAAELAMHFELEAILMIELGPSSRPLMGREQNRRKMLIAARISCPWRKVKSILE